MKTLTKRLTEVFAVVMLFTACVISAGQLAARAQDDNGMCLCGGCLETSDCSEGCFCNRPSGSCYDDTEEQ